MEINMKLIFDIEANGLYDEADRIWCIVTKDIDTGQIKKYTSIHDHLNMGILHLEEADELIGHNIIDYDLRLIKKLYPSFNPKGKILDTMILSQLLYPERQGGHSLEAFGEKYGIKKPEHEDWSRFSPEMLHRCTEDTEINCKVYDELMKESYESVEGVPYNDIFK